MRIQHNLMAMNTHRQLSINQANQAKATEKLSSGYRINRAGDDAAGLAISEKMRAQIRGLNRASANAQDGISLIQAAEGALQESHSILQRMRELAIQGANDVNQIEDREAIIKEINQLGVELDRIASATNFNGKLILSGIYDAAAAEGEDNAFTIGDAKWVEEIQTYTAINDPYGALNLQVGANTMASDVIQVSITGVGALDLLGEVWTDISDYAYRLDPFVQPEGFVPPESAFTMGAGIAVDDAINQDNGEYMIGAFQALVNKIDSKDMTTGAPLDPDAPKTGIALISEIRANLGAVQNRLEHTISNLDTVSENVQSAESRIRDVDMAKEMMAFTKDNILNQAATAMLAQANMLPQNVLSLIR